MPAPRKPNKGKSGKKDQPPSVLESEKSILRERQRQLDEKIAALNRTIKAATVPGYRIDTTMTRPGAAPAGKKYGESPRRPPKKVVLRAEKQEGRLQTFALVLVVILLVLYVVYKFT